MLETLSATQIITAASALAGSMLTGIVSIILFWINKRFDERKHRQQIIIHAAIKEWNRSFDLAKEYQKAGQQMGIPPLDLHLIHQLKLAELLSDQKLSTDNLEAKLDEFNLFTTTASKWYKENRTQGF